MIRNPFVIGSNPIVFCGIYSSAGRAMNEKIGSCFKILKNEVYRHE